MNRLNKLDCSITQLETHTSDKCSNLLGQFLSYEKNKVLWIRILYYKTFYSGILRIFVTSKSVCPWQAYPA